MKTSYDLVNIVWQKLHSTASLVSDPTKLTGGIYKKRPTNSNKEDIEVNSLGVTNEQLQRGVINVNVFVPNKPVDVNGIQDTQQPDFVRLKELTDLAVATLKDVNVGDYSFDIQQQNMIQDQDTSEYYSNIRIDFFYINL
jgi:hypothetical protein